MFNKQEIRKSKYKYGGTKVCKAEEVRKYFVNHKIESFRLACKLPYLQFGFQVYRSSRSQMFFGTGAPKNFAMLEFLYNEVAGLQVCNFIKKRLQNRCFSVKFAKSLTASFSFCTNWVKSYLHVPIQNYLLQSISVKLIYPIVYIIY